MTTNRREELDEALIRKGRADVHLELSAPDNDQFKRLFERFDQTYNGETFKNMAEAQNYLLS
jgi:ATP-dependent 26S proteasome regulatory subunit